MIDFVNLQKMIDRKYIAVRKHPKFDLFIYNYTSKTQFESMWNNETLQCRGLIMDSKKNIISRPFKKFFNLQEVIDRREKIPDEDFIVTEKIDGSLGISYFVPSDTRMRIATRGSFVSDQALKAQEIFNKKYKGLFWNPNYTYLFEIIYPENRIVVDYGDAEELILLAVIDTSTGEEFSYDQLLDWYDGKISIVKKYDISFDFRRFEQKLNAEGYVIFFPISKQRLKVKFDEYLRLHKLITGVSKKKIWDIIRSGGNVNELLDRVPDKFYTWVKNCVSDLKIQYDKIRVETDDRYRELIKRTNTRKEFALESQKYPRIRSYLFMMLDNKAEECISNAIWESLKPKHETPFQEK